MQLNIYTKGLAMKRFILVIITFLNILCVNAQDKFVGTIEADVVNKYVWRGMDVAHASVQPTLGVAYKGFSLKAWGSLGITDSSDTEEIDLTLSYTTGGFTFGVTDYWLSDVEKRYFLYTNGKTSHVFEANVGYDFGFMSVNWFTNFAGNDGLNKSGNRAYSSYLELAAPFRFVECDWTASLGVVPYASSYYETDGFAVTNVSLKAEYAIKMSEKFKLPVFAGLTANPCSQKFYLTFGLKLKAL